MQFPVRVFWDQYGIEAVNRGSSDKDVLVYYEDEGQIDSSLRYVKPVASDAMKTAFVFHFVSSEKF
jgi:hypothetical protein